MNLDASTVAEPVAVLGKVELPRPNKPQDPSYRRAAAAALRTVDRSTLRRPGSSGGGPGDADATEGSDVPEIDPFEALEAHPLHHHPDRRSLLAAHGETSRLEHDIEDIEREITRRGAGLVARFDAVIEVLESTGHVETGHPGTDDPETDDPETEHDRSWQLTPAGQRLRRIYHECDLLISLALERGVFDGLEPAELAAVLSFVTYEHRSAEPPPEPILPTMAVRDRHRSLLALSKDLHRRERAHRVPPTREPEGGFAAAAWSWASGQGLDNILDEDLTGGDFVRNVRQLVDLLSQIALVAPVAATRAAARSASNALVRGVIAASSAPDEPDEPDDAGRPARARPTRAGVVTIEKGRPWGEPGPLAEGAPVVAEDRAAGVIVAAALSAGRPPGELGLIGGDLHRSLGAPRHSADALRAGDGIRFPIDVGVVELDGRPDVFVAHLVATEDRSGRLWRGHTVVLVNGSFVGPLDLGPRAHPNDGRLDLTEGSLPVGQRRAGRRRALTGTHLPHPDLRSRQVRSLHVVSAEVGSGRPLHVWLDGHSAGRVDELTVTCRPDAVTVVV